MNSYVYIYEVIVDIIDYVTVRDDEREALVADISG